MKFVLPEPVVLFIRSSDGSLQWDVEPHMPQENQGFVHFRLQGFPVLGKVLQTGGVGSCCRASG